MERDPFRHPGSRCGVQRGLSAVETELRRDGERVFFVVRADVPLYQDRLVKMGWSATAEPAEFVRRLDAVPDVERVFERFAGRIETMVQQIARVEPIDWEAGWQPGSTGGRAPGCSGGCMAAARSRSVGSTSGQAISICTSTMPIMPVG